MRHGSRPTWPLAIGLILMSAALAAPAFAQSRFTLNPVATVGAQLLSVVPAGVNGMSTIHGVEIPFRAKFELYSYGGLVYAASSPGNRLVREWTVGANRTSGKLLTSVQFSQMDRSTWPGRSGAMTYFMFRVRYTVN